MIRLSIISSAARRCALISATLGIFTTASFAEAKIDPVRIKEIAAMLRPAPASFGQPIANRAAWEKIAAGFPGGSLVADAERLAAKADPEIPDDLYLDFSRTGNRDRAQKPQLQRESRLAAFALAECVENRGRFLAPLQRTIEAICAERSWTLPAHDARLDVFEGRAMNPDLRATTLAFDVATTDYLLGDKLSAATRQLIRQNVRRRVLQPFRDMVEGRLKELSWLRARHNWNAVCLAGTTGAALALEDAPEERAWFIAAAEHYIAYYLSGFTPDGYGTEGIGYWNYGFGRFVILTEAIRQSTGGKDDLFAWPAVAQPALFGFRSEILNGIYPSISDCRPGTRPDRRILRYVSQRFDLPSRAAPKVESKPGTGSLAEATLMLFEENKLPVVEHPGGVHDSPLRTWFNDGGVLICRPGPQDPSPYAVAIKGGNNGENHSHNDVGSFSVVAGNSMVICDPGGEVYTRRTFSSRRYESKVINSFGHSVPIIDGKLQRPGASARAVVLRTSFSDDADTLALDIRSAYPAPELKKLERTFVYRRGARAGLTVRDEVALDKPGTFESALITWGHTKNISPNEMEIADNHGAVRVKIDSGGAPFSIHEEEIDEHVDTPKKPRRIGIALNSPVTAATVVLTITPEPVALK
jgi:hypothetical protein